MIVNDNAIGSGCGGDDSPSPSLLLHVDEERKTVDAPSAPPKRGPRVKGTFPPHVSTTHRTAMGAKPVPTLKCTVCLVELSGHTRSRSLTLDLACRLGERVVKCSKCTLTEAERTSLGRTLWARGTGLCVCICFFWVLCASW